MAEDFEPPPSERSVGELGLSGGVAAYSLPRIPTKAASAEKWLLKPLVLSLEILKFLPLWP